MSEPQQATPGRMLGGLALILIGLLILVPSGLCTAFFGAMSLWGMMTSSGGISFLPEAIGYGAPPIAVGALLIFAGRRLRRADNASSK
jgi:hypothetical protein